MATTTYRCLLETRSSVERSTSPVHSRQTGQGLRTPKQNPGQTQDGNVGGEVEARIGVVKGLLVEAGPVDGLVPVVVDGPTLQEQADSKGALLCADETYQAVKRYLAVMDSWQTSDEEEDDGDLDRGERWGIENLGRETALRRVAVSRGPNQNLVRCIITFCIKTADSGEMVQMWWPRPYCMAVCS